MYKYAMVEYIGRRLKINIKTKKRRASVNSKRKVTFNGQKEDMSFWLEIRIVLREKCWWFVLYKEE